MGGGVNDYGIPGAFYKHKYFACKFTGHYACRNAEMNNNI